MINVRAMVPLRGSAGSDTCNVRQALKKTSRNISATPESKSSCSESSAISFETIALRACSNGMPTRYKTQPPATVKVPPLGEVCLVKTDH